MPCPAARHSERGRPAAATPSSWRAGKPGRTLLTVLYTYTDTSRAGVPAQVMTGEPQRYSKTTPLTVNGYRGFGGANRFVCIRQWPGGIRDSASREAYQFGSECQGGRGGRPTADSPGSRLTVHGQRPQIRGLEFGVWDLEFPRSGDGSRFVGPAFAGGFGPAGRRIGGEEDGSRSDDHS